MRADRSSLTIRFRIDLGGGRAIGPGKIALLEQIAASGSLSQAGRNPRMSYRRAWQLLESLNQTFSERVVATSTGGRGGGGAALTPLGIALIQSYRHFEADIQGRAARHFGRLDGAAEPKRPAAAGLPAPVTRLNARARGTRGSASRPGLAPKPASGSKK